MKKNEFDSLDEIEKLRVIDNIGFKFESTFTRFGEIKLISFYSIDNFFVELLFNLKDKTFESIKSYESIMFINQYKSISKVMDWKIRESLGDKTCG